MTLPRISEVRFVRADDGLRATGLEGWVSFVLDGRFKVEGVGVRRTQRGRPTLAFAYRDDGFGRRWHFLKPINNETRLTIEEQVFEHLYFEGLTR